MEEIESGPPAELAIEAPPGLLPNLSEWGLEEIERGVVEDTFENRRTIKSNKGRWNLVFDMDGNPTPYLQVVTAEMYQAAQGLSKTKLLVDPDDYNADYLSGVKLLLAENAEHLAPTWVLNTTRTYMRQQEEKRALGEDAALHQSRLVNVPTRCTTIKGDGTRCWNWSDGASDTLGMCRTHAKRVNRKSMNALSQIQAARNRLISSTLGIADGLEDLAFNAESESVRLGAMNSILDRAGLRGGFEIEEKVEVKISESAQLVQERLRKLREGQDEKAKILRQIKEMETGKKAEEIVDAEVVDDEQ